LLSARSRIGRKAEIIAAAELGRAGYRIIESNYRCNAGEIDFIAQDGDYLAFVEVRCKRTITFGSPAESINLSKQRKLIATGQHYLDQLNLTDTPCRFDVVEVVEVEGKLAVKEIIKGAFTL
jgi:putative endonuclease